MKKFPVKLIVYSLVAIPIFISCENNDPTAKVDRMSPSGRMILENASSYLTFSTHQAFADSVQLLSKLNRSQLDSWEKSTKFSSLRRVYETIVDHEIRQADIEEQMIMKDKSLLRTMKHKISPLIGEASAMIKFSLEDGVSYKLFSPAYATVLNKDGIVKVGKSLFKYGEQEIAQIVNGDEKEIGKLLLLNKSGQTDNLKYYPVQLTSRLLENNNAKISAGNALYCEQTSDNPNYNNGDTRLKAWARGSFSPIFIYSYWQYNVSFWIEMNFTRKTWYGSVNHNSGRYSSNGSWSGSTTAPISIPSGPQAYSLAEGFDGTTSSPNHYFHQDSYIRSFYQENDVTISGTFNFKLIATECTAQ